MNQSHNLIFLKSHSGMSLLQVLLGLSLMSIVGLAAAHISADAKRAEVHGNISSSVNQIHLLAIQKTRNLDKLKTKIGIAPNTALSACLSGYGTGCTYQATAFTHIASWDENHDLPSNNTLQSQVRYSITCSTNEKCELVTVRIETQTPTNNYRRSTDIRVSGTFLGDRPQINFNCTGPSNNIITGVNFQTRTALCNGGSISGNTTCSNSQPMTQYITGSNANCAPLISRNCATGFQSVGVLNSQWGCAPP